MHDHKPPESRRRPLKDFLLLVAGALGGLVTTLILETQPRWSYVAISAAAFAISAAYGLSLLDRLSDFLTKRIRDGRIHRRPLVGVLADMPWDRDGGGGATSWANITSSEWVHRLEATPAGRSRLKAMPTTVRSNLDRLNVLLNPYGGVYPEHDTISLESLQAIFCWVADGGLFVNVADLPGYWMYHTQMGTKVDATPAVYGAFLQRSGPTIASARPFDKTPFMERLSIRVFNVEGVDYLAWPQALNEPLTAPERLTSFRTERLALVEKNIRPILAYQQPGTGQRLTPLFYVPYGRGTFLFSLYFLDNKYPQNAGVCDILCELVLNRVG